MPRLSLIQRPFLTLATMALVLLPAVPVLAQSTPDSGAAPAAAAPAAAPPAATPPPAAATPPATATTTAPAAKTEATTAAEPAKPAKKKAAKKMTRQQELDRSIDSGTVPARYRSQVPKEYHHLIPFDKR
jgi:hypothetical protein